MTVARDDPLRWYRRNGYAVRDYDARHPPRRGIIVHDYDGAGVYGPRWEVYDANTDAAVNAVQLRLWSEDEHIL